MNLVNNFYAYLWPGLTMQEMRKYGNNCNSYLVAHALPGNKHVLVDPGQVVNEAGQNCLEKLIAEMRQDRLKIEDVDLIIDTHAHPDHYGASEAIRKLSGAKVAIGKQEHEFLQLASGEASEVLQSIGFDMPEIHPDLYLTEGELRLSKDLVAQIILIPGHSDGHIGIYWPQNKIFMCGDVVFWGSTGRTDFPGGSAGALMSSIEKIAKLDIEYLLTGHQYGGPGIIKGREQIQRNFELIRESVFPYL